MALIAIAADKGSPGVTTASVALAAVWPRPVLLAECDPAGGDLAYRFPAAGGGRLDPSRGLLNLAVAARHGLQPHQVWEHSQKLHGGLDILAGVSGAEQGAGLELFWGAAGRVLAAVPQADVIADCGRLGADAPIYDLLAHAACVVLLARPAVGEVIRLRDRAAALTAALQRRGRLSPRVGVVVVADYKSITSAAEEVGNALRQGGAPVRVIGGLAHEPKSAEQLRGAWGGRLDKSMFIRTARAVATDLAASLPGLTSPPSGGPQLAPSPAQPVPAAQGPQAPAQSAPAAQVPPPASAPGSPSPADPAAAGPVPADSAAAGPAAVDPAAVDPVPAAPVPADPAAVGPAAVDPVPAAGPALGPQHSSALWAQPPAQVFRGRHAGGGGEEPRATDGSPLPEPASGRAQGRAGRR